MGFICRGPSRELPAQFLKSVVVTAREFLPQRMDAIEFAQLLDPEGCGHICHVVHKFGQYKWVEAGRLREVVTIENVVVYAVQAHGSTSRNYLALQVTTMPVANVSA
jgi:hypothetical protein